MNWKKILHSGICLLVVLAILLNCVPVKVEAVALEAALGIGVAACLILMTAGVIFNPQTVEDIQAIGQNFQTFMYKWGTEAEKLDEVQEWFSGLSLLDPEDEDGPKHPNRTTVNLARGLLVGISLWVASIALNKNEVQDPNGSSYYTYSVNGGSSAGQVGHLFVDISSAKSFLAYAHLNNLAMIYAVSSNYLVGWFWDEQDILCLGLWENPSGVSHVNLLRPHALDDLTLVNSCWPLDLSIPIFYNQEIAAKSSLWSKQTVYSFNWNCPAWTKTYGLSYLRHDEGSSSWTVFSSTTFANGSLWPEGVAWANFSKPANLSNVSWIEVVPSIGDPLVLGDVQSDLESGTISEEEVPLVDFNYADVLPQGKPVLESIQDLSAKFTSGELTVDQYLEMVQASDPNVGRPGWVKNIALFTSLTYTQGAAAEPLEVEVEVLEGSTASYEWYRYGTDPDGNVYPVECLGTGPSFCPPTAEVGTAYYYCRAAVTDAQGMVAYNYSTSAEVEVVPGTSVEPGTGTDSEVNPDSIGQQDSKTFWEKLPQVITQPLEALGTTVVEGVRDIFVPSQDYLTDKVDTLSKQFPFITPVVTLAKTISLGFKDVEPEPPIIYLHLEDTRGSYDLGGTVPFIDMTWYSEYKPVGDALLSSLLWVVFIWRLFRQLPGLIAGMPGEYNARILDVLNVTPPSRSISAEVHRQSNRQAVRDAVKRKGAGKK